MAENNKVLFPEIEPFNIGYFKCKDSNHEIYYEQVGNKTGIPILYLHGGPGGGISPYDRRYFDPQYYHAILFDQRGCGNSKPSHCLENNNTWELLKDIEELRRILKIDKWYLFGGSWGSTLCLVYSISNPQNVLGLILRGIFTLREKELKWLYEINGGASYIYPSEFNEYISVIPEDERSDMIKAYYRRLSGEFGEEDKLKCAKSWSKWEMSTSRLIIDKDMVKKIENDKWALSFAIIECHYFINKGFYEENYILNNINKIKDIKVYIVQGRYDIVCPLVTSYDLSKLLPSSEYYIIPNAGHSAKEEGTCAKLVEILNNIKKKS